MRRRFQAAGSARQVASPEAEIDAVGAIILGGLECRQAACQAHQFDLGAGLPPREDGAGWIGPYRRWGFDLVNRPPARSRSAADQQPLRTFGRGNAGQDERGTGRNASKAREEGAAPESGKALDRIKKAMRPGSTCSRSIRWPAAASAAPHCRARTTNTAASSGQVTQPRNCRTCSASITANSTPTTVRMIDWRRWAAKARRSRAAPVRRGRERQGAVDKARGNWGSVAAQLGPLGVPNQRAPAAV